MKYINVFDDKSALDSSLTSLKHGDGAFIFGVKTTLGMEDVTIYDLRHPGPNCPGVYNAYPVNMSPVKLDSSSTKTTPDVGDILYSTSDGKLTLDSLTNTVDNTAIAICVIPEVLENFSNGDESTDAAKTARFVSINYMSHKTPTIGSTTYQNMYFGNYSTTIGNVKGSINKDSYVGGKWNTLKCLHACTKENKDVTNGVTNDYNIGYCAPVCCCVAYSTLGTKSGDWYLPSIGELYQLYANKTVINEKRTTLVGSGFYNNNYWSSRECSSYHEYCINLDNGSVYNNYAKLGNICVLSFLALKV